MNASDVLFKVDEFLESKQGRWGAYILNVCRNEGWTPAIFGGCIRDLFLGLEPRDVDIVVKYTSFDKLKKRFSHFADKEHTTLGGLRLTTNSRTVIKVDIWAIQDTVTCAPLGLFPSFFTLPFTSLLNTDGIIVEPEKFVYTGNAPNNSFYHAFENKFLELNNTNYSHASEDYINGKLLNTVNKLNETWTLGPNLKRKLGR